MSIKFLWRDNQANKLSNENGVIPNGIWKVLGNENKECCPTIDDLENKKVGLDQRYFLASWQMEDADHIIKFVDFSQGGNWYLVQY